VPVRRIKLHKLCSFSSVFFIAEIILMGVIAVALLSMIPNDLGSVFVRLALFAVLSFVFSALLALIFQLTVEVTDLEWDLKPRKVRAAET
jgi:hypothetical protein